MTRQTRQKTKKIESLFCTEPKNPEKNSPFTDSLKSKKPLTKQNPQHEYKITNCQGKNRSVRNEEPRTGFSPYLSLFQSEAKNRFSPEPRTGRRGEKSIEIWEEDSPTSALKAQSPAAVAVSTRRRHSSSPLTIAARRSRVRSKVQTHRPLSLPLPSPSPSPLLEILILETRKKILFFIVYYFFLP